MFKKSTIYFLTLLLFMSFSELSLSEEVEEEIDIEAVEETAEEEAEEEKDFIKDIVEDFESSKGFIHVYQDPETSSLYFKIKESQLDKEFIYFAHVRDGVVAARRNRGSYLDNGVLKFEKHFDTMRLVRVNTNFSFDDDSALSKSAGANISDSVIKVFPINSMNESEDEFLINVSSLFVSESLTLDMIGVTSITGLKIILSLSSSRIRTKSEDCWSILTPSFDIKAISPELKVLVLISGQNSSKSAKNCSGVVGNEYRFRKSSSSRYLNAAEPGTINLGLSAPATFKNELYSSKGIAKVL